MTCKTILVSLTMLINIVFTQQVNLSESNLPIIIIDTSGETIVNEPKIEAHMGIIDGGTPNYVTDIFNDYDGVVGIEIRGASSASFPKKSYAVETWDSNGNDIDVSLLGMPEEEDWILYGPYTDKTMMRNTLIYELVRQSGKYASRTKYCELIINNEYMGVYVFMEKIKKDNDRVDISKLSENEISGDDLTGGYIIKIDKKAGAETDGWESDYEPFPEAWQRVFYQYHYPKGSKIASEQKEYIQNFMENFEATMADSQICYDPNLGYRALINVESLVDYFIFNELAKNLDAYIASFYLYKDKDSKDARLHFGPVWDFNLSMGNNFSPIHRDPDHWRFTIPLDYWEIENRWTIEPFWLHTIWEHPQFQEDFRNRWNELRNTILSEDNIMSIIDDFVDELDRPQERNYLQWDVLDEMLYGNPYIFGTYEGEVGYLKNWLSERLLWIDENIMIVPLEIENDSYLTGFTLLDNFPNPFNPTTSFRVQTEKQQLITIKIFNVQGELVDTIIENSIISGNNIFHWNASGYSTGIYICVVEGGKYFTSNRMLYLK